MYKTFLSLAFAAALLSSPLDAADAANLKIAVVNFKECVENSKIGKEEQGNFEKLKKQMEEVLEEKEKNLNDLVEKTNDPDYLDSLSATAETDLKRKLRNLSQEMGQLQNQYMQALNQANFKIVQKLNDVATRASKTVAQAEKIDLVLNDEGTFFYEDSLNISAAVTKEMDNLYAKEDMGTNIDPEQALNLLDQQS